MNGSRLDLNLLLAFEALFLERSVTKAARRLGVTQPAMSNALQRLRVLMRDPVFVRASGGMSPTSRTVALGPTILAALDDLRSSVNASGFDPLTSIVRFTLGTLDYLEALYLPSVTDQLSAAGGNISLRITRLSGIFDIPADELESGAMDCALGLFPQPLPPRSALQSRVLHEEEWVGVARRGHGKIGAHLSVEDYAALQHLALNIGVTDQSGLIDRLLAERGVKRSCPVTMANFTTLPFHVAQSDCIATLPRHLAETFADMLPLQIFAPPITLPPIKISLIWHSRSDADEAQRWFRALMINSLAAKDDG